MSQDDTTLGGYFRVHDRPPAFEGSDGHPYTVSVETEKTGNLGAPFSGFLVFPQWAQTGVGIVGHVETPTLVESASAEDVTESLGRLTLYQVQDLLEDAIGRRGPAENAEAGDAESPDAEGIDSGDVEVADAEAAELGDDSGGGAGGGERADGAGRDDG
jgi:hypothetical protein